MQWVREGLLWVEAGMWHGERAALFLVPSDLRKQASDRLLGTLSNSGKADSQTSNNSRNHELAVPSVEVLQKLNESAISMLGEIARKARLDDPRSPDIAFVEALLKA